MNKEIYKQNITALRNKYPAWANIIKNRHKKKNIDVIVEKSVTGDTILKVKKNGKILYLNGKYAPDEVGKPVSYTHLDVYKRQISERPQPEPPHGSPPELRISQLFI